MPLETKKVLWTVLSVVIVLVCTAGIALVLLYPRSASGAPASVAAVAPPRSISPDEYLHTAEPLPSQPAESTQQTQSTGISVYYGDKPEPAALSVPATQGETLPPPTSVTDNTTQQLPQTEIPAGVGTEQPAVSAKPYTPARTTSASSAPASPQKTQPAARPTAKPSSAKPAPTKVSAQTSAIPKAQYWIQAAAFTSRTRAGDLQRQLSLKGLASIITVKELDNLTWYRVRVGPYAKETEAKVWNEKIRAIAGCGEAYVSKQTVKQ